MLEIDRKEQLYAMFENKKNKSKRREQCPVCKRGYMYQYRGRWSKCDVCGYGGPK